MKALIKEEIYKFIATQGMTEDEIKLIDTYVLELLENLEPMIKLCETLDNKDVSSNVAKLILDNAGE